MVWTKARILASLKKLHRAGADLSYNALARARQPLLSAAAYHFGSYRAALARADIDYAEHLRRPRWTRQRIIGVIKHARRAGRDLHWSAVTRRRDELARAAFASLQPRLFGRWDRALHAAGLDADDVSCYRTWDRNTVVFELRARQRDGEALNSAALQQEDAPLHAAAVRYFESLRKAKRRGTHLSDSAMRGQYPALYGAAVRLFGSFPAARTAAGVAWRPRR